nr:unnamed protein product [Callosobruchus analis]
MGEIVVNGIEKKLAQMNFYTDPEIGDGDQDRSSDLDPETEQPRYIHDRVCVAHETTKCLLLQFCL